MTKIKLNHIDLGGDQQSTLPVDLNLYILVQELPERGKRDKIYLVKDDTAPEGNIYNEYSYINGAWESLGQHSSSIDVSGVIGKDDVMLEIAGGQNIKEFDVFFGDMNPDPAIDGDNWVVEVTNISGGSYINLSTERGDTVMSLMDGCYMIKFIYDSSNNQITKKGYGESGAENPALTEVVDVSGLPGPYYISPWHPASSAHVVVTTTTSAKSYNTEELLNDLYANKADQSSIVKIEKELALKINENDSMLYEMGAVLMETNIGGSEQMTSPVWNFYGDWVCEGDFYSGRFINPFSLVNVQWDTILSDITGNFASFGGKLYVYDSYTDVWTEVGPAPIGHIQIRYNPDGDPNIRYSIPVKVTRINRGLNTNESLKYLDENKASKTEVDELRQQIAELQQLVISLTTE